MAVYKVIQDIEAEDKLLGPLTLKGFVYAGIAAVLAYIEFRLLMTSGLGAFKWVIVLAILGPLALFAVLASPLGRQQPTEVWLLAHIMFLVNPRKRAWDQSGTKELVTITVPKRIDRQLTKGFSQTEVQSRLKALASTLDTRGWSVKNVDVNLSSDPGYFSDTDRSDRLIEPAAVTQDQPVLDIHASDDILDAQNNPRAQHFTALMKQADSKRKEEIQNKMNQVRSEPELPETLPVHKTTNTRILKRHDKLGTVKHTKKTENKPATLQAPAAPVVTPEKQAAKLELAQSGNDLSVASIAKLANHKEQMQQVGPNEFVLSLH